MFQKAGRKGLDRMDHVWLEQRTCYKCCLCGAICAVPPEYPTSKDWLPNKYEVLTDDERSRSLPVPAKV